MSNRCIFITHCCLPCSRLACCSHILEHEDNEMMRPLCLGQPNYTDPRDGGRLFCPGPGP